MWLILPDEGYTPDDILADDEALKMITSADIWTNRSSLDVHLQLPKFDVSCGTSLASGLKRLGIQEAFSRWNMDFSPLSSTARQNQFYLSDVKHAARLIVDETGVEGAAYTVSIVAAGNAIISEQKEIDFFLDRPFLFVITCQQLPLFAGIVNDP